MSNILKKVLQLVIGDPNASTALKMPKNRPLKKMTERELLQLESEIGAKLFGDIPVGTTREFFCLDEKTWIWHEQKKNPKTGKLEGQTIRYEVHDNGILKVQEGARYAFIEGEELDNLVAATALYYEQVAREIYQRDPRTGQKLV
jgi:hypothetical protein